jgi:hypothetical protein
MRFPKTMFVLRTMGWLPPLYLAMYLGNFVCLAFAILRPDLLFFGTGPLSRTLAIVIPVVAIVWLYSDLVAVTKLTARTIALVRSECIRAIFDRKKLDVRNMDELSALLHRVTERQDDLDRAEEYLQSAQFYHDHAELKIREFDRTKDPMDLLRAKQAMDAARIQLATHKEICSDVWKVVR